MLTFFRQSLRGRLVVLVILVAGSLGMLAGLLIWRAFQNERDTVFHELGGTARAMASLVDQRFANMEALLQGLIAAGELEDGNIARFYARALRASKPDHRWFVVTRQDGQQVLNTRVPFGTPLPRSPLPPEAKAAMASDGVYISNVTTGSIVKEPVFSITAAVRTPTGFDYHVSLVVSSAEFAAGVRMDDMPPTHVIAFVDRNGIIGARSRNVEKYVGTPASPDVVAAALTQKETVTHSLTVDGEKVLAAVAPAKRSGWSAAVGAPRAQLHASARKLVMLGLLTSFAILAAATAVAWWIVRTAIHDVTALMRDTRTIAVGALPEPSTTVLAETRSIAASLRTMAEQLHRELEERRLAQAEVAAAKDELAHANIDLENKVRERTASLAELVSQMEEFTYSISHDLRAPVRAIITFGQVINEDHANQLHPEVRPLLDRMIAGGARMDRMINDLLSFSRISRQDLTLTPVNADQVARECVQDHPVLVQHAGAITIEGKLPVVLAHAPSLHQVITNLLTNAVKFVTTDGGPRVRLFSEQKDDVARIWVCDNGIGIEPRMHRKLFKLFERVHSNRTFEGTGIGLAIVRRAIERMEGRVGVESEAGQGARFWIELKLAVPNTTEAVSAVPSNTNRPTSA